MIFSFQIMNISRLQHLGIDEFNAKLKTLMSQTTGPVIHGDDLNYPIN